MAKNETVRAAAVVPEQASDTAARKLRKLPKLPSMGKAARKPKASVPCACGCGELTKSTWYPGHDAFFKGLVLRLSRGVMTVEQVRELAGNETAMRATMAAAVGTSGNEIATGAA